MGADGGRFSLPPRFESVGELRRSVFDLYANELVNASSFADVEETVHVGVIDSVYDPGDDFASRNAVARTVDLLPDEDRDDTTGHGRIVAEIIAAFCDKIEFSFYRVTQATDGGTIWGRHLIKGLGRAHLEDEVDVVNLSVGNDHSGDGNEACARGPTPCKLREATQMAIDDGIVVVGAAGNESQFESVCCPALLDEAICVGGFVSKCDFRLEDDDPLSLAGRYSKPPKACWIDQSLDLGADDIFCSGLHCSPGTSCEHNRRTVPWEGNVAPANGKPDVLAPAMLPVHWKVPQLSVGTSWATAFVTSVVAETMAGIQNLDAESSPQLFRRGFLETADELDDESAQMLNAKRALIHVFEEQDLPRPRFGSQNTSHLDFDPTPWEN